VSFLKDFVYGDEGFEGLDFIGEDGLPVFESVSPESVGEKDRGGSIHLHPRPEGLR
jgi:hypothetical protein